MSEIKFGLGVVFALLMLFLCKNFKEMQDELKRLKDKDRITEDEYNIILKKLKELKEQQKEMSKWQK